MRALGPFYSGEVLPPFLVEQASHACWASLSCLLGKPLILVEQTSHACRTSFLKRGGQVRAFALSGAHAKDGLYLLWACGHRPIGLANGPIGLAKPYFIFILFRYKGKVLFIQTDTLREYIVCYIAISKGVNLINIPEILFIHKTRARLIYKNSIHLQASPLS